MTKLTSEQYAKTGGVDCPACGESGGVDSYSNVKIDGGVAWQDCECSNCGASWTDQYKLVGYDGLVEQKNS